MPPTNPDREALLQTADSYLHITRNGHTFKNGDDTGLVSDLATALREEMAKQDPEWICREGHTFRYSDGKGCPHCLTQARANLRRVAEMAWRHGSMYEPPYPNMAFLEYKGNMEAEMRSDLAAILAQLDKENDDED